MSVLEQITAARGKYGDDVYGKTLGELRGEFGELAFPVWLSKYEGDEDGNPLPGVPRGHEKVALWQITEGLCYLNQALPRHILDDKEKLPYFTSFVQALKYDL